MNKKKQQPSAVTPLPTALAVPSPLHISLEPNASIKVALDKTPANTNPTGINRSLYTLFVVFTLLFTVWGWLFYSHVVNRRYSPQPIPLGGTPLLVTLAYPARTAFGDENELDVIVTNSGNDNFTGNVVISLTGAHLLPNEPGALEIKSLNSKESKTYRLKFALLPKPGAWSGGIIRTSLQTYANNRLLSSVAGDELPIARLPYARVLILWLRNSALTGAIALLLWEVIRKALFGWEAK